MATAATLSEQVIKDIQPQQWACAGRRGGAGGIRQEHQLGASVRVLWVKIIDMYMYYTCVYNGE